jgi:alkylated DNA repair dioxygenase AlkB
LGSEQVFGYSGDVVAAHQRSLFAGGEPALAPAPVVERVVLDATSWIDLARSWLLGTDALLDALVESVTWHQGRRRMYDRTLDDPRLSCWFRDRDALPHPIASTARAALESRYGVRLGAVGLNYYRDGRDSVAPHNDHLYELVEGFPIALLSLGSTRRMTIRAKQPPRRVLHVDLEPGSLLLMSYETQLHYTHGIPKTAEPVGPRISLAFRVRPAKAPDERPRGFYR